jgi:cell division protein ZapA
MNIENVPVTVRILEKEYHIACPRDEKDELLTSAEYLNRRMREIRNSAGVVGADKIAILAALNICHEFLTQQSQQKHLNARMQSLQERIDTILRESPLPEI